MDASIGHLECEKKTAGLCHISVLSLFGVKAGGGNHHPAINRAPLLWGNVTLTELLSFGPNQDHTADG